MRNDKVDVRPLSMATGAEIRGVDLRDPLSDRALDDIRQALYRYGVVFFRDQDVTPAQHAAFAARFGEVNLPRARHTEALPGFPMISEVRKEPEETRNIGGEWHTDNSFQPAPPLGSILVARDLPPVGGDTQFASMQVAYETLSDGLKRTLESLRAVHAKWHAYYAASPDRQLSEDRKAQLRRDLADVQAVHPVVVRHPESGRKALFVNPLYTVRFDGWTEAESAPLLDHLFRHALRSENTCRFDWRDGSIAFWDNRLTWHNALNNYHGSRRLMHRITIKGTALG